MGCGQSTPGGTVAQPTANAPAPKEQAATGTAPKPHTSEAAAAPAAALGTTKAAERKEAQTHQGDVNEKYQMGKALGSCGPCPPEFMLSASMRIPSVV
jgi:hypothetical protein